MTFFNPVWLLLALPLFTMFLVWKAPSKPVLFLRTILVILVVFALAGAALKLPSGTGTVVIVADRSQSMPPNAGKQIEETADILFKTGKGKQNIGVVSFAEKYAIEQIPMPNKFDGLKAGYNGSQSNLKEALEAALTIIPDNAPARILLLSDGRWTGQAPAVAFAQCAARGIPVDYRMLGRANSKDLAIAEVESPFQVPAGEFFPVAVNIQSPGKTTAEYSIFRNGKKLLGGKLKLTPGSNRFYFRDRSNYPQILRYRFAIKDGSEDKQPENNRAEFIVKVKGQRPVLLVSMSRESGFGKVLKRANINVEVKRPNELSFSLAELAGYSGIIIENVPAENIGSNGMELIRQLVENTGTGLLVTGGKNSYGIGGYYKSALDEIMPVSMDLKKEHRKLSMSIVIAMDRSGSMGCSAGMGRTKMDMANMAAVEVLKLLNPLDSFGVIAVDSSAHTIVPLTKADAVESITDKVLSIQSMGGGIFVYNALAAATRMLMQSDAGTRHIILFSDAADSEQPGKYKELLEKATQSGITVSVIGLGSETDCDANFLRDVALRGLGRCFFSNQPQELPRLFAQDTFVVARNTFVSDPVKVSLNGSIRTIGVSGLNGAFQIGGYNLNYLRPGARCAAVSDDDNKAPIIAFWNAQLGRVLCYCGEIDGKYTGDFANWKGTGKLLTSMTTWCAGLKDGSLPGNMLITQELKNGTHVIKLHLDPDRQHDPFQSLPEVTTLTGQPGRKPVKSTLKMHWTSPDILTVEIPLHGQETSLATVLIEKVPPQVLSPVILPYSPEFKPQLSAVYRSSIADLAKMTGGVDRVGLAGMWDEMPEKTRMTSIARWLLLAAVIVLLLEVLERRTGLLFKRPLSLLKRPEKAVNDIPVSSSPQTVEAAKASKKKRKRKKAAPADQAKGKEVKPAETEVAEKEEPESDILNAFNKLKKR